MLLHSYDQPNEIDQYYLKIANRIQDVLTKDKDSASMFLDETHAALTANRIAGWFEDVISGTGIWQAFTKECHDRFGQYLPLYPTSENYFPDEINIEDIEYQIWHACQCAKLGAMAVDPWSDVLVGMAQKVYEILDQEFEQAPENTRLKESFTKEYGPDDFFEFRSMLQWFHYNSFFNVENAQELNVVMQSIYQSDPDQFELFSFSETVNLSFLGTSSPLGLTTPEWLRRIVKDEPLKGILSNLKARPYASYKVLEIGDKEVKVQALEDGKEQLTIRKDSLGEIPANFQEGIIIHAALVSYMGIYWMNGAMGLSQEEKPMEGITVLNPQDSTDEPEVLTHEKYLEITGGKEYLFFEGAKQANQFLRANVPGVALQFLQSIAQSKTALVLLFSDEAGLLCLGNAECLSHADNAQYTKSPYNAARAFSFLMPNICPWDISSRLMKDGLLKDAAFPSFKGSEKTLKKDMDFLMRYFHAHYDDED